MQARFSIHGSVMNRLFLLACMALLCTACGSKGEIGSETKPEPPDSAMEKAVKAPLVDLNLLRKKIPDILRSAKRAPYGAPENSTCDALGLEISQLDVALGADLDQRMTGDRGGTLMAKGAEEAGDAAADALKDLTTGWIPYRGWVRRLTGAERYSREVSKHIAAGLTRRAWLKGLGAAQGCVPPAAPAAPRRLYATWRLVSTQPAPWSDPAMAPDRVWLGQSVVLEENNLTGPHPLNCDDAEVEVLSSPPEGLFEGGLPAPADVAAANLGFTLFPVETLRVTCDNASFDLHRVDGDTLLFALDNQIWTLVSTVGSHAATSDPTSPEAVVEQLLEVHFASDMAFTRTSIVNKRGHMAPELLAAIDQYFATLILESEAPLINGDPFTDSQEYPARFAVDAATITGDKATVPVRFADAWRQYRVIYSLGITSEGWRITDLQSRQGSKLSDRLRD
jgi:hypothetical protein